MKKIHLIKTFIGFEGDYIVESITSFNTLHALKVNLKNRCLKLYADQSTSPNSAFSTKHDPLRFTDSAVHPAMLRSVFAVELWYLLGSDVIYLAVPSKYLTHFKKKNQEHKKALRKYAANAA